MGKEIISYVKRHLRKYPKMETIDVYKMLFQEVFLNGHLVSEKAYDYLLAEYEKSNTNDKTALYEYISDDVVRINLYPYKMFCKDIPLDKLFTSFLLSSKEKVQKDIFQEIEYVNEKRLCDNRVLSSLCNIGVGNNLIPTHSSIYKKYYEPSYRVIHSKYLDIDIRVLKLKIFLKGLSEKNRGKRLILACEGICGSGKTTITNMLDDVTVIHVDDFFPENANERLNFSSLEKVLQETKTNNHLTYMAYDCHQKKYVKKEYDLKDIVLFEGVYSYDKQIRKYYDYLVYFVCTSSIQKQRLEEREKNIKMFYEKWIPRENDYYEEYDFILHSDILI